MLGQLAELVWWGRRYRTRRSRTVTETDGETNVSLSRTFVGSGQSLQLAVSNLGPVKPAGAAKADVLKRPDCEVVSFTKSLDPEVSGGFLFM